MSKRLSPHFRADEFACPCCGQVEVHPELLGLLEEIREAFGDRPITISEGSGFRCEAYNESLRPKSGKNSYHKRGMAADFNVQGVSPELVQWYLVVHDGGLGAYSSFTHVDIGPRRRWIG